MSQEVATLTQAIELVAAGSWAIESAIRCLQTGDQPRAREVLEGARDTLQDGLAGLSEVLDATVQASLERPERLARALASLEELRHLSPVTGE